MALCLSSHLSGRSQICKCVYKSDCEEASSVVSGLHETNTDTVSADKYKARLVKEPGKSAGLTMDRKKLVLLLFNIALPALSVSLSCCGYQHSF